MRKSNLRTKGRVSKPKTIAYNVGEIYDVDGILARVSYINNGKAWLCPLEEEYHPKLGHLLPYCSFERLDQYGKAQSGKPVEKLITHDQAVKRLVASTAA